MPLSIGGGVKSLEDADSLFHAGADKVVINSMFYSSNSIVKKIAKKYGEQAVVFSLDVKKVHGKMQAVANGSNFKTGMNAVDAAISAVDCGAGEIYLNSVDHDGCMNGYDLNLIKKISETVTVPVVAAGGCGNKEHCVDAIMAGADAIAASSIFFWAGESIITIKDYLLKNGIEVRLK
jgi:cyclase